MNDKKVTLNAAELSATNTIKISTQHFHTVGTPSIRLGADNYLYIEERCLECGKILNGRRIKTEPLQKVEE
jgi:hypothetical protein